MSTKLTHWKTVQNTDYIGAYSLMESGTPEDLTVTIKSVGTEEVTGQDGKKDVCLVAQLVGQKPFIINATNAKTITKLYKTPFIENWAGKKITLFVSNVKVGSDTVEALRIRPMIPAAAAEIDTTNAINNLNKATSLKDLQAAYLGLSKSEQAHPGIIKLKDELKTKLK